LKTSGVTAAHLACSMIAVPILTLLTLPPIVAVPHPA
jgi:hypothetical protein